MRTNTISLEITDVILERVFQWVDEEGNTGTITLQIGKPYKIPEPTDSLQWRCHYRCIGLGLDNIKTASGIDSIDALLMALRFAAIRIKLDGTHYKLKISWLDDEDLNLSLDFSRIQESEL